MRRLSWYANYPDEVTSTYAQIIYEMEEEREEIRGTILRTIADLADPTLPANRRPLHEGKLENDHRVLREQDQSIVSYLQEPVPGMLDMDLLTRLLEDYAKDLSERERDSGMAWLPPQAWVLAAQLPGAYFHDHGTLKLPRFETNINLLTSYSEEPDWVTFWSPVKGLELTDSNSVFLPPGFIARIPGGPEYYSRLRTSGVSFDAALLAVVETLCQDQPAWVDNWFPPELAQSWHERTSAAARRGAIALSSVASDNRKLEQLLKEGFDEDAVLELVESKALSLESVVSSYEYWSQLYFEPGEPGIDTARTLHRLAQTVSQTAPVFRAYARPEVFAQLSKAVGPTGSGLLVPAGHMSIPVMLTSWVSEDQVSLSGLFDNLDHVSLYMAPGDYTDAEQDAYQFARENGLTPLRAREAAKFTMATQVPSLPESAEPAPEGVPRGARLPKTGVAGTVNGSTRSAGILG